MSSPLAALLRGYLHQDYDLRYASVEDALRAFREESTPHERRRVIAEIDTLLAAHSDDAALYAALRERGFVFYPPREGATTAAWLQRAKALLR
ncbi:MAG: contact-dependent growth inhibition system immunity protein [Vulcanimicrobiaceae bacterium]